jgi:hypothetical protein
VAAPQHAPPDSIAVGLGGVLALPAVGTLTIVGGRNLPRGLPLKIVIRLAAAAMAVLSLINLISAIRGRRRPQRCTACLSRVRGNKP